MTNSQETVAFSPDPCHDYQNEGKNTDRSYKICSNLIDWTVTILIVQTKKNSQRVSPMSIVTCATKVTRAIKKPLTLALFATLAVTLQSHAQEGDVAAGEKVFKKCTACHKVGEGAKNKVGPVLNGVFGRTAGTLEGYKYGKGIVAAGENGLVWDEEQIFAYIENPKQYLRDYLSDKKAKSKMSFRLKKEEDRRNVIAYLKTFSPDYQPAEAAD